MSREKARLCIQLLGPFRAALEGQLVTGFVSDKARALLVYLAVEADHPHRRERLAGMLWPDCPERDARTSLRTALANVRLVIGDREADPPFLRVSSQTIQFNRDGDSWIDVAIFTRCLGAGTGRQPDANAISQLEKAVELYEGEFLEGFSVAGSDLFADWALLERERYHRLALEALECLIEWYEACGQIERALPYAWRQVDLDAFRERSHRQLMRILALDGQRAAALAQYDTCCAILQSELDTVPDDGTNALYQQIKAGALEPLAVGVSRRRPRYSPLPVPEIDHLSDPGPLPPGSRLPFGRNALFTGRREPLLALARGIVHGRAASAPATQTIQGMGGVGKTQLAVEFAYRYGRFFHGVHWLDCAQPDGIAAEIAICGEKMRLQPWPQEPIDQLERTLQAWCQPGSRHLVILDNLEAVPVARRWLRRLRATGAALLVTARRSHWPRDLGLILLRLKAFSLHESCGFLRAYLPVERASTCDLERLARRLGGLPLALELAGRYLDSSLESVAGYLDRLGDVLTHPSMQGWMADLGNPTGHDLDLAATFAQSWQRLQRPEPRRLFALAGYCAPAQPIPRSLLAAAAGLDEETCGQGVGLLTGLGLLDLEDHSAGPTIHPLLAEFARALPTHSVGTGEEEEAFSPLPALVAALAQLSWQANEVGLPARFAPLRPHLEAAAPVAEKVDPEGAATLWTCLGYHRDIVADYAGARAALERALKLREDLLPPEHPLLAVTHNYLGIALHDLSDLSGARAAYERALAITQAAFGPDHPDVGRCLHSLGLALRDAGDLDGALAIFEQALGLYEKELAPQHPSAAALLNNLGEVLRDLGDLNGARAACERALAIDRAAFGPDHPRVARDLNSLGTVLRDLGDLARAQAALERALALDQAAFGPAHHNIARDVHNLGTVSLALGDLSGARTAFERALALFEERHGPEHPHVATVAQALGQVLRDQGDLTGAQAACERALAIDQAALGPEHPTVARDLSCLSTVLRELGDLAGARAACQRARAIDEAAFGPRHPGVARDANNLGTILRALGDTGGAQAAHQRALAIWEEAFGREHPATAQALWGLGTLAAEVGSGSSAREYLEEALAILEAFLPSHHPDVERLSTQLERFRSPPAGAQ